MCPCTPIRMAYGCELSAHAYNTIEDYERLAEIVAAVLRNDD